MVPLLTPLLATKHPQVAVVLDGEKGVYLCNDLSEEGSS